MYRHEIIRNRLIGYLTFISVSGNLEATKRLTDNSVKGHSTTNDTNNSCHIKSVELVEHSFRNNNLLKTLHKYLQRTHRNSADFWDFKNTSYAPK